MYITIMVTQFRMIHHSAFIVTKKTESLIRLKLHSLDGLYSCIHLCKYRLLTRISCKIYKVQTIILQLFIQVCYIQCVWTIVVFFTLYIENCSILIQRNLNYIFRDSGVFRIWQSRGYSRGYKARF